jgi:hypothetical protein
MVQKATMTFSLNPDLWHEITAQAAEMQMETGEFIELLWHYFDAARSAK